MYISSIVTGFLLALGTLELLPNYYWNICFYMNVFLCIIWNMQKRRRNRQSNNDPNNDTGGEGGGGIGEEEEEKSSENKDDDDDDDEEEENKNHDEEEDDEEAQTDRIISYTPSLVSNILNGHEYEPLLSSNDSSDSSSTDSITYSHI